MSTLTPPLKWHGGKTYLAKQIVGLMPPHTHYVEPFAGGLAVLLEKDPNMVSEVANDLNGWLSNFWRTLQHEDLFQAFRRRVEAIPFSQVEWEESTQWIKQPWCDASIDRLEAAVHFFVCARQSMAGRMSSFSPLSRTRTRRAMNEQASSWLGAVEGLPAVHARLKRVAILNQPAVKVIQKQDGIATLFYLDPPYVPDTRATPDVYHHEMSIDDHVELIEAILNCQGKVMLSGYDSELYSERLKEWTKHRFDLPNNSASGPTKQRMTEVLWCNF